VKKDIHPKYHEAKVKCGCGVTYSVGSTLPEYEVEICGNCHPFYTGAARLVDTAGRVDRFKARLEKKNKGEVVEAKKEEK
jgi:large subunit ribosomal protein L31